MDYFKQRRAYRNFKMYEASVSNGQNNLYRELLDYANDEGKLDVQFRMKNSALLSLTGLSEPGLDKARNSLVQLGLIKYIKGKKNVKPPEYRVVKLYGRPTGYPTSNPTTNEKSRSTGLDEVGQPVGQGGGQPVGHKELTGTDLDFTGTDHDEDDAGVTRGDVIDKWTSLWGFPNAIAMPEVNEWLDALPADVVDFAITIAGEHQVKATGSLKYMRAVIEGWQKRDISTLDQAKKAAEEHDKRMKSERGAKPTRAKETLPDWAQSGTTPTATRTKLTPEQQEKINARIARLQQNGKTEQEATP
ncbi:DnaD domain protein [Levilactobacillus brevis]|uniref:DnaD domain protein n=1 Tax=Levilactobacillus brevis TaxID=1580 RepID=UPI000847E322|nr:DnaD domain protein [Levilactobacillus brevis]ODP94816.1 DNA replication protein DnaD [Levilactobacillus brevis]